MLESTALATFEPVSVRARHDGWTPERQREFIEHLADTGSVTEAASRVGMSEQSAYRLRRRQEAEAFDAAWEAALERGLQRLTGIAFERAINGAPKRIYYHGELVAEERVFSDRLLIHLLKQGRAALGRSKERLRIGKAWDESMDSLGAEDGAPAGGLRLWQDEYGTWLTNLPPPARFDGCEEKHPNHPDYNRTLTKGEKRRLHQRGRLHVRPLIEWIT